MIFIHKRRLFFSCRFRLQKYELFCYVVQSKVLNRHFIYLFLIFIFNLNFKKKKERYIDVNLV